MLAVYFRNEEALCDLNHLFMTMAVRGMLDSVDHYCSDTVFLCVAVFDCHATLFARNFFIAFAQRKYSTFVFLISE